jgi:putative NADH-flavin reductase
MQITIIGGTQGVGLETLRQALDAGYAVRALARNPQKIEIEHQQLTVEHGDVLVPDEVAAALSGSDAVVVSLGGTENNPANVVSEGTRIVIEQMQSLGIERLIVVTSLGVGDSKKQVPTLFQMLANTFMKAVMEDKERQEEYVRASGLRWTIVRPGGLVNGPRTGRYESGLDKKIAAGRVNRADVADFIVRQLEDDAFINAAPAVT